MTIKELHNEVVKIKREGIDPMPLLTEINEKISLAFSCFAFVLLGAPLAIITRRREKSINFGIAFLIVGLYYLMLMGSKGLSLEGYVNPAIAMWLPNMLLGLIGLVLTFKVCAY